MNFENDFSFGLSDYSASRVTAADGCTQCGICISNCPTFRVTQDIEQSPMGRLTIMRKLASGEVDHKALTKLDSCLLCGTCETVCPSKVAYTSLFDTASTKQTPNRRDLRLLLYWAKSARLRRYLQPFWLIIQKTGLLRVAKFTRVFTRLNKQWMIDSVNENRIQEYHCRHMPVHSRKRQVRLFKGCVSGILEPQLIAATQHVLSLMGIDSLVSNEQTCCGALHRHQGLHATANALAEKNIDAFSFGNADKIITMASGCHQSLALYPKWLESNISNSTAAHKFSSRLQDINLFLDSNAWPEDIYLDKLKKRICIHTPCSADTKDIHWVNMIPGASLCWISERTRCCGAGGSHQLTHAALAASVREETLNQLSMLKPDILLTTNTGCASHLRSGIKQKHLKCEVMHPVELLADIIRVR